MSGLEDKYGAEIGMRVICQRCGSRIFLKQTGYNNVDSAMANRHSFVDQFEPIPDGWVIKHDAGGWLCPKCAEAYDNVMRRFLKCGGGLSEID